MKAFWISGFALFLLWAGCAPDTVEQQRETPPEKLLANLVEENRFYPIDKVAHLIIANDPSLLLADVRSQEEFEAFSLPGAANTPLEGLLSEETQARLDCGHYNIVFFSNSDIRAEQAWVLSRRMGCENVYIMKGGLKAWAEDIVRATPPPETASAKELELYKQHLAARKFFIGSSKALEPEPYVETAPVASTPKVEKRKRIEATPKPEKKAAAEEGC
ncbi:MAG: rhodanese-like domain-containing protein [Phaeodactylibacter sp.]|nr:rhodanese-like domain-containing protein [Phaeodactylibacter sp.]MCB9275263.1 rhodanese-like domain-containing protein [Lewinellaceae bacterium]